MSEFRQVYISDSKAGPVEAGGQGGPTYPILWKQKIGQHFFDYWQYQYFRVTLVVEFWGQV